MKYRTLPRGGEALRVIGLGMGAIHALPEREIAAFFSRNLLT